MYIYIYTHEFTSRFSAHLVVQASNLDGVPPENSSLGSLELRRRNKKPPDATKTEVW